MFKSYTLSITEPALLAIKLLPSALQAAPPILKGSITSTHLERDSSMVKLPYIKKNKEKIPMVEKPSHVKQLSLNHICKLCFKEAKHKLNMELDLHVHSCTTVIG
jgi:hypothetical protein